MAATTGWSINDRRLAWAAPTVILLVLLMLLPIAVMAAYTFFTFVTAGIEEAKLTFVNWQEFLRQAGKIPTASV